MPEVPPILAHIVRAKAQAQPDFDVLTFVDIAPDGTFVDEVSTYGDLWRRGCAMARRLEAKGVKAGDRFALVMQNHPEFVEAMIAASILGAIFVPIDPRTKGDKLVYMLDFAECTGAIVADYALPNFAQALPRVPRLAWIATFGKAPGTPADPRLFRLDFAGNGDARDMAIRSNDPDATMQLLYTSGTTGDPKAIVATHRRFAEAGMLGVLIGLESDDKLYTGLSLTHANAQLITLGMALQMGLRAVISRKFTKSRLWDITRWYGCTVFNLLGGMTVELYSQPPKPHDAHNPVRMVLSAGMPAALWKKFAKRFGVQIFEFYGAAEGGLTLNPPGVGPIGSVGKPPPNLELAILDDDGNRLPAREPGEICFRPIAGAPSVRYLKNEEASHKKTAAGWLHTGDIGHVDADGWLYFQHRKGDEIRRNGEFIAPGFVEKAIAEHPQVVDVFVYGVPAQSGAPGERDVVAAIVPVERGRLDVASVFAHCRRTLEPNAVPSYLQVVAEIPKTASEKPQERFLREQWAERGPNIHAAGDAVAARTERTDVMKTRPAVVVYGASGYTGKLICERLVDAGIPFIAAGRDEKRLTAAVADLPNAKKAEAEVAAIEHDVLALARLFEGARLVANVVGPFGQLGRPVADAAFAARCHYIDTTGETDWIRLLRDEYGPRFAAENLLLCPALAYMWTAGQIAAETALEAKGIDSLDIVYAPGSAPTIASTLSFMRMVTRTQYRLVNRALDPWPNGAAILNSLPHSHEVVRSLPWGGGAEPIWYEHDARVRNCRVTVALQNSQMVDWLLNCAAEFDKVAASKSEAELEALTNSWGQAVASTPPREDVNANRSVISCRARGAGAGKEVVLYGAAPYEQTGVLMAEGARRLLDTGAGKVGFQSPAAAFGHRQLMSALAEAGLHQAPPAAQQERPILRPQPASPRPAEIRAGH